MAKSAAKKATPKSTQEHPASAAFEQQPGPKANPVPPEERDSPAPYRVFIPFQSRKWEPAGVAFKNRDGSFSVCLNGKVSLDNVEKLIVQVNPYYMGDEAAAERKAARRLESLANS